MLKRDNRGEVRRGILLLTQKLVAELWMSAHGLPFHSIERPWLLKKLRRKRQLANIMQLRRASQLAHMACAQSEDLRQCDAEGTDPLTVVIDW